MTFNSYDVAKHTAEYQEERLIFNIFSLRYTRIFIDLRYISALLRETLLRETETRVGEIS